MNLYLHISGLDELQARADESLVRDPAQRAIEAVGQDLATPKGSGKGVQVNSLSLAIEDMSATIETSLNWPRTSGISWMTHTEDDFEDSANQALEDAGSDIEAAWEA